MKSRMYRIVPALLLTALALAVFAACAPSETVGDAVPEIELLTTTEAYDPIRYEAAFMIADAWEELGFAVNVRPLEFSSLLQLFYDEQNFDATILGWSGRVDRLDPQHFLGTLHGGQTDLGANNPGGYSNPDYDALFEAQSREFNADRRRELVLEMQEIAARDQPLDVLFYRDEVVGHNSNTFDNYVIMAGESLYNEWTPLQVQPLDGSRYLTIGTPQEPDNINPMASTSVWGWKFMRMYYDKLVRLSPDIEPIPWAAEEIIDVDETTIDVVIRSGMTFHDGEPVTPSDVKFTFDYMIEKDFAYFRPFYSIIDSTEIRDGNIVRFNLREPYAPFITVTLSQIPILPEHLWASIDAPADLTPDQIPTVGSGPFYFDQYDRGEYKRLLTFRDHFAADDIAIDGMEYIVYADSEGVFTGLLTGEIDMTAWRMEPGQITIAEDEDHITVVSVGDFGYYHLTYNNRRAPFDNTQVRRALAHAVDKETIINVLLQGLGEPGYSVVAPINGFWHNPDVERFDYDLSAARSVLEEAGFVWDGDGRIHFPAQ
ncbi:MAG: ABC transporter substrate-binding protein [Spirochaetaceae bacterium]|nr:MAG: ABC transporter substrate-binding protein [Spirochaetaceae bacterium]